MCLRALEIVVLIVRAGRGTNVASLTYPPSPLVQKDSGVNRALNSPKA